MNRLRRLAVPGVLALLVFACGKGPRLPPPAPPARAVEGPGAMLVPRFRPPADGRLTPEQLERYLRVRRAARGRTDREAARALGIDPDEFFWVRGRIVEALVELQSQKVRTAAEAVYARTLASLRESRKSARDAATARTMDEQIAGMERERSTIRRPDPAPAPIVANARLVAGRRVEIDSVSR